MDGGGGGAAEEEDGGQATGWSGLQDEGKWASVGCVVVLSKGEICGHSFSLLASHESCVQFG